MFIETFNLIVFNFFTLMSKSLKREQRSVHFKFCRRKLITLAILENDEQKWCLQ